MATMLKGKNLMETLMRENSLKGLFGARRDDPWATDDDEIGDGSGSGGSSRKWIRELSSLANVVASRCARILFVSLDELQKQFDQEAPESAKAPAKYARNLVEYFCFRALAVSTQTIDYLSKKEFRRLTFDMMLAWETPGAADKPVIRVNVDTERTVGKEAFVRLGPAIAGVADPVTVHCQYDVLTTTSGGRLQYATYEKYLGELEKTLKTMKNISSSSHLSKFQMVKGETVVELEGTVTTQPVLQHAGVSTWPGRLTLTDHALYFESIGVVSYDKAKKFDLAGNYQQKVKPELTGPWGARLFDKAILCKSTAIAEPLVFEFPEFTGHARRDYWLSIVRELICAHQFIRKYELDEAGKAEVLSRAVLGIARLRAIRDVNHVLPPKPEYLLTFLAGEELAGGDLIMEAIARILLPAESLNNAGINGKLEKGRLYAKSAAATLTSLGASTSRKMVSPEEPALRVGEFLIGDLNPIEKVVMQSRDSSKRVELAQSSIEGVKVDGIEMNIAVMKELILPLTAILQWIGSLQSWNEPFKSAAFLIMFTYVVLKDLLGYVLPVCLLCLAGFMLWFRQGQDSSSGEVQVISPATQNAVEQLLALQQGLTELKDLLQAGNIFLLKLRAILFSTLPQATNEVVKVLVIIAFCLAFLPPKLLILLVVWEAFTRQIRLRQESTERIIRRLREWWYSVPVVPVRLLKVDEDKKKT